MSGTERRRRRSTMLANGGTRFVSRSNEVRRTPHAGPANGHARSLFRVPVCPRRRLC